MVGVVTIQIIPTFEGRRKIVCVFLAIQHTQTAGLPLKVIVIKKRNFGTQHKSNEEVCHMKDFFSRPDDAS